MSTSIRTTSEKQMNQIRRFAKKNKIQNSIIQENGVYTITLFGLTISESEKLIKNYLKINRFANKPLEPHVIAA